MVEHWAPALQKEMGPRPTIGTSKKGKKQMDSFNQLKQKRNVPRSKSFRSSIFLLQYYNIHFLLYYILYRTR